MAAAVPKTPKANPTPQKLAAALETLRHHRARVTAPRRAILAVLTGEHGPFTIEEIHQRMEKGGCDLVTVYRSIAAMEEIDLVRRCDFGDGAYRYEFNTGEHHHHHIVCRACRSVETLDLCVADGLERMARQLGYGQVTHTLEIFGVCQRCRKTAAATAPPVTPPGGGKSAPSGSKSRRR